MVNSSRWPGCFIAFEGIDGSGKTEQCKRLASHLYQVDYDVFQTIEPTKTLTIGNLIRKILHEQTEVSDEALALLFAADRADHTIRKIIPALKKGTVVLSDRYVFSSFAYQGKGMSKSLDLKWLIDINHYAFFPDIVFFLDIPAKIGMKRLTQGQKRFQDHTFFENRDKQEKIRAEYYSILNFNQKNRSLFEFGDSKTKNNISRYFKTSRIKNAIIYCIDGTLPIVDIEKIIYTITINYLRKKQIPKKAEKITTNSTIWKYAPKKV